MPFTPDEIAEIQAIFASSVAKKRIPELNPNTVYGDLSLMDRIALWMNSTNKTVYTDLITLKTILTTGGTGSITPVLTGSTVIVEADASEEGTDTILRTELAGKTYFLRLEGRPLKQGTEWQLLSGGFKLLGGATVTEGQRFDADIYELQATSSGTPAALSSSYIVGKVNVTSNTTLNGVNHANKIIQLRGGSTKVVLTMPDIATTPENAVFIIEASINNDWQTKVQTQGGQFIYMNNTSFTSLYVGKGEVLVLFRDTDGWYVINDFGNYYKNIGKPYPTYSIEDDENEILCDGSDYLKVDYPRLWEKIQTLGAALTNDLPTWTANKGMWLDVDIASFRVPDLRKMILKGIDTGETAGRFEENQMGEYTDTRGDHGSTNTLDTYNNGSFHFKTSIVNPGQDVLVDNTGIMWAIKY